MNSQTRKNFPFAHFFGENIFVCRLSPGADCVRKLCVFFGNVKEPTFILSGGVHCDCCWWWWNINGATLLPSNHFLTLTTSYNRTMFSTFPSEERCGWKFYSGCFLLLPQAFFPFVRISREVNELFLVIRKEKWLHGAWKAWKSFAFSSF